MAALSSQMQDHNKNKNYPFMNCLLKVNTRSSWQRTVRRVLKKCHGVYSFRMDDDGLVQISGTVDQNLLLKMLEKVGGKVELCWFQFGECSSNLFMPINHSSIQHYNGGTNYSYDGRYLHPGSHCRPEVASQVSLHQSALSRERGYTVANDHYGHQYNHHPHHQLAYHDHSHVYDHAWSRNRTDYGRSRLHRGAQNDDCCILM